jgi:hypothetical protein
MAKASEWASRVASWRASGLTSSEFSKGRGYSHKSLLWWSCQLRRKPVSTSGKSGGVRLARVIRVTPSAPAVTTTVLIEIEGARVAVPSGANAETLRAVFDALRARAGTP